ncbi:MAG: BREX-1 system adenine-specific DNA-methyltransferase PglX [Thiotrichales bacterium]|nr:BREX-1 system adenine-specific DNA-methyltransferase PglX [Thiotrichales bacterium]
METTKLKRFAQFARSSLIEQISAKLKQVLAGESAARREHPQAVQKLEQAIQQTDKQQVIERVAYIWFNRFCALRFMDVNRYNLVNVVSPANPGQFQPEMLAEAKMGHIDDEMVPEKTRERIAGLLEGKLPSRDPQGEAYRLLVVAACNFWNKAMPFLFQRIDDYTELLMPDDLLSGNSILAYTREAMTPDACEDVEVIGWLYQFYISEKKDEVFDGLKKNKKITPENIPAATQLFTPHWIVRYLVENSLGRLWLLNRPGSKLIEQMDYYIKPEQAESDFLRIAKPEEIKICDPACGSGHMLTYAFDLLYAIYEEEGYEPAEIPEKILTNNLYGIEIDERAGELAAFALTMKARAKQRRFFNKGVKPNICVLENIHFDGNELKDYMDFVGRDWFTAPLQTTLRQFEEADNFGSLIRPDVTDVDGMLRILESKNVSGQLFISMTHQKVLQALRQVDYLSPKYHVVVANPPYATASGLNQNLRSFSEINFPNSKNDLYSMFIERNAQLAVKSGLIGMITMQSWMYLKTFQNLREMILNETCMISLLHLGPNAFPEIQGERVQAATYILENSTPTTAHQVLFFRLISGNSAEKERAFLLRKNKIGPITQLNFLKLSDFSVAYKMLSIPQILEKVLSGQVLECSPRIGSQPGSELIDMWWEKSFSAIGARWQKYNKGGTFRKWYGNAIWVLDYGLDGRNVLASGGQLSNQHLYGKSHISWTRVSSRLNLRFYKEGVLFDNTSPAIFENTEFLLAYLNSKVGEFNRQGKFSGTKIEAGHVQSIAPFIMSTIVKNNIERLTSCLVTLSLGDWDSNETSWDFTSLPLLQTNYLQPTLKATYQKLRTHWQEMTLEMQRLEQENNRIFIDAYGLQDELTPEVPLNEITLTCNPWYRYGKEEPRIDTNKHESKENISVNSCSLVVQKEFPIDEELEALLLADTMRELVSYAVGCMFGRYALDKPGLILANQGETIEDYLKRVPEPSFPADDDNVIPILDGDWFTDDIAERFRKFLRVAFGEEHYEANLKFVEKALGKNGKARDIRNYFLKDFYSDHVKRYKKRPIYWLFSSPKGSFNALIYMHRYRSDTVSVVLNDYLREFRTKLTSHKNHLEAVSISASASAAEKTKALKEIDKLSKVLTELDDYERDVLYPLATQQISIDLDDGVKVNYPKFGSALKKITGLEAKED